MARQDSSYFNTAQGWSRDMSTEIAREVVQRARSQGDDLTGPVRQFDEWELERAEGRQQYGLSAS